MNSHLVLGSFVYNVFVSVEQVRQVGSFHIHMTNWYLGFGSTFATFILSKHTFNYLFSFEFPYIWESALLECQYTNEPLEIALELKMSKANFVYRNVYVITDTMVEQSAIVSEKYHHRMQSETVWRLDFKFQLQLHCANDSGLYFSLFGVSTLKFLLIAILTKFWANAFIRLESMGIFIISPFALMRIHSVFCYHFLRGVKLFAEILLDILLKKQIEHSKEGQTREGKM